MYTSRHGRAGTAVDRKQEVPLLLVYKAGKYIALPQLFGDSPCEYIYTETYTRLISYLAQSRPSWQEADLQSRPRGCKTGNSYSIGRYRWPTARHLADVKLALKAAS